MDHPPCLVFVIASERSGALALALALELEPALGRAEHGDGYAHRRGAVDGCVSGADRASRDHDGNGGAGEENIRLLGRILR